MIALWSMVHGNTLICLLAHMQLSDPSASERQWACHSLWHLMEDAGSSRERLLRSGVVVNKAAPLLMDKELSVREAAMSLVG